MEIAVAVAAELDDEMLINYLFIIAAIPITITCVLATFITIILFIMLVNGFFSLIILTVNVLLCMLTGVEPGTGMDGMFVIADIIAVALIVFAIYFRPPDVERDAHEDEDEDDE